MANIKKYTKKDGSTAYQFSVYLGVDEKTGKKKRTTRRGFKTKKEAKHALARLELGDDAPKSKSYKKYTTFRDVYELWWENYLQKGLKPSTVEKTKLYFRVHILPVFGDKPINSITVLDCQKAVNAWSKGSVCSTYKGYASKIFRFAVKLEIITTNPMELVDMPRKKQSTKKDSEKYFSQSELTDFLNWVKTNFAERDYAIFRLLSYSGMRRGEAYALNWSDIDFTSNQLTIDKSVMRVRSEFTISSPKNNFSIREITLDNETVKILKHWKLSQKKELFKHGITPHTDSKQLMFTNRTNGFLTAAWLNNVMDKYPKKRLTPHGLRHTHATLLLNDGVPVNDVQRRLGHADATMTLNVYGHASTDDKYVADQFANILKGYSKG